MKPFLAATVAVFSTCAAMTPASAFEVALQVVAAPSASPPAQTAAPDIYRPTPDDVAAVDTLSRQWFAAVDAENYPAAYALLTPGVQRQVTDVRFADLTRDTRATVGAVKTRDQIAVKWYDSPPGAPSGLYAALDYQSTYEKAQLHCSFLILYRPLNGTFGVLRTEAGIMTDENAATIRANEGEAALKEAWNQVNLNCPDL